MKYLIQSWSPDFSLVYFPQAHEITKSKVIYKSSDKKNLKMSENSDSIRSHGIKVSNFKDKKKD